MKPTDFILVRHGETTWNLEGRRQGQSDSPLTPLGLAQARAIAERLADEPIDALYSSDLTRTLRTAEQIAAVSGLPVISDPRLREKSFGVIEGLRSSEVPARYPEVAARMAQHSPDYAPPGGESLAAAQTRVVSALEELVGRHTGGRLVIVSHGAVLGMFLRHALDVSLSARRSFTLENGSLSFVSYWPREAMWHITSLGEISHLRGVKPT